jgi:hypothetical protein
MNHPTRLFSDAAVRVCNGARPCEKRRGRFDPFSPRALNGCFRRSAEACVLTDRLLLTAREQSFALQRSDGKVCPLPSSAALS